jgi:hypothetical protein
MLDDARARLWKIFPLADSVVFPWLLPAPDLVSDPRPDRGWVSFPIQQRFPGRFHP